jgi:hypothetical protein
LEGVKERDGTVTPEGLVLSAEDETNPLHKAFTWDDSIAATKYRLEQARLVMRSIEVVYTEAPEVKSRLYRVTSAPATETKPARKVYKTVKEILADPIARDELLSQAIRDALAFRKAYSELSELAKVFKVMDEFVANANKLIS